MIRRALFLFGIFLLATSLSDAQTQKPTLLQQPTVSQTHIVFVYSGDLWIVPREGGEAKQLTTGIGLETDPVFSPDGSTIAFSGQYDGNTDVFTVPASGGVPKRITYHPVSDAAIGWTSDGKRILFSSGRESSLPMPRLFTIGSDGKGLPDTIPLPMASEGSYSPDGSAIAYQPLMQWQPYWKRYKGGQTMPIWIARLSDSSIEKLPRENSNDQPDVDRRQDLFPVGSQRPGKTCSPTTPRQRRIAQLLNDSGFDIKSASAGPGAIVYEQFGSITLYDLKSKKTQQGRYHAQRRSGCGASAIREGRDAHHERRDFADRRARRL